MAILLSFTIGRGQPLLNHKSTAFFMGLCVSFEGTDCIVAKILDLFELRDCRRTLNQPFVTAQILCDMFDSGGKVPPRGFE